MQSWPRNKLLTFWPDYVDVDNCTQKSKTQKANAYSTILGDVGVRKVIFVFIFGHPKSHFRALDNGHFCQKWPILGTKKWYLDCPNQNSETTFQYKLAPKAPKKTPWEPKLDLEK